MTRTEKLDKILSGLLWLDKMRLNEENISKRITIDFISNSMKLDCECWELKSLENELVENELINRKEGELYITAKGKRFIIREKGFKQQDKIADQEDVIREKTIEKFRYDKIAFWMSVIALIIAGISLVATLLKQ